MYRVALRRSQGDERSRVEHTRFAGDVYRQLSLQDLDDDLAVGLMLLEAAVLIEREENHRDRAMSNQRQLSMTGYGPVRLSAQLAGGGRKVDLLHR